MDGKISCRYCSNIIFYKMTKQKNNQGWGRGYARRPNEITKQKTLFKRIFPNQPKFSDLKQALKQLQEKIKKYSHQNEFNVEIIYIEDLIHTLKEVFGEELVE